MFAMITGMFVVPASAEGDTTTITQDNPSGTMTVTLVIPKKTPAATDLTYTAPSDLVYSGSDKAATVEAASGVTGMGTITVKYYSDASRTTEATPENVGTYYVGATIAEGDNYTASTAVLYGDGWTFEITKSTPSAPSAPTAATASKNSITLTTVDGCEYSKDGTNWQDSPTFTGLTPSTSYTFYERIKETVNNNASSASSATISTTAKDAQTITAENVAATYGDTGKAVIASTNGGGTLSYAVTSGDAVTVDASTGALTINHVGTATVTVTAAETADYAAAAKDVTVTVNPKAMTVSASDVTVTRDGQPHGITVRVTDPASGYIVKYGTAEGTYDLDASPTQTEAGTLTVYYQVTADNYITKTGSATVTVRSKSSQTITASNVTATYGDTGVSISATTSGNGTLSYALKSGSAVTVNAATGALTIFDAFVLHRRDDALRRFLVGDEAFALAPRVAIGAPRGVVIEKAALHRIGEDATQTGVDTLDGVFGERLSIVFAFCFPQLCVELAEVLGAQVGQLDVAERGEEAVNIPPFTGERGFRQFVRCDVLKPKLRVLRERDVAVHRLRQIPALAFEEDRLLVEPSFLLLRRETVGRPDGFLLCRPPLAAGIVTHRHDEKVAVPAFSDACHCVQPLSFYAQSS